MYQYCYPLGSASASLSFICCIVQTDLSAELALRPQYQCCFHNIIKSANYTITLYIKTVLILSTQECSTNVNYLVVQCIESKKTSLVYEHGKISCFLFTIKIISFNSFK